MTDFRATGERLARALAEIQQRAASTRGDQAYRELPRYVVNACRAALDAFKAEGGKL